MDDALILALVLVGLLIAVIVTMMILTSRGASDDPIHIGGTGAFDPTRTQGPERILMAEPFKDSVRINRRS